MSKKSKMMKKSPKALTGALKQTEGYTPKSALGGGKKAGEGRMAKMREKRLEGKGM